MTLSDLPPEQLLEALRGSESIAATTRAGSLTRLPSIAGSGAWLVPLATSGFVVATRASDASAATAKAAGERGVGPRVVDFRDGWLVTEYLDGRHLTPLELSRPTVIAVVGRLLASWHATPIELAPTSMAASRAQYVAALPRVTRQRVASAVAWADHAEQRLLEVDLPRVPAHLDVAANVLAMGEAMWLIDFEWAAAVPAAQELGQLVWEAELDERATERLVTAYRAAPAARPRAGVAVAEVATWSAITGVTWSVWAMAGVGRHAATVGPRYARRSWERWLTHWAHPDASVDESCG